MGEIVRDDAERGGAGAASGGAQQVAAESALGPRAPSSAVADRVVAELRAMLEQYGVSAVLALLNARTRYRFTGVYRVEPPLLRNVHLYDRENPALDGSGGTDPLRDTYCASVVRSNAPFAWRDDRAAPLVARSPVLSYLGVPIRGADGRVSGTLCHHDCRPRLVQPGEETVLARVATAFASQLLALPSRRGRPAE